MNEFLESNLDNDILLSFKFGEDNIIFKYPNKEQIKGIKKIISDNFKIGFSGNLRLSNHIDIYRYMLKELCNIDTKDYDDKKLIECLNSGKEQKKIKYTMESLIREFKEDVKNEFISEIDFANDILDLLSLENDLKTIDNKMKKVTKEYNIDKKVIEDIKSNPEMLVKTLTDIKNKIKK